MEQGTGLFRFMGFPSSLHPPRTIILPWQAEKLTLATVDAALSATDRCETVEHQRFMANEGPCDTEARPRGTGNYLGSTGGSFNGKLVTAISKPYSENPQR